MVAVDLGSSCLRVVVGKAVPGGMALRKVLGIPISVGLYGNGDIANYQELRSVLSECVKENGLKGHPAVFTFSSIGSVTRVVEVPNVKQEEMKGLVDFEIQQFLPADIGAYITQYKVIGKPEKDAKTVKVMAATIPRVIAEDLIRLCRECDLEPACLDIHTNAISKLLKASGSLNDSQVHAEQRVALVELGNLITEISIYEEGEYQLSRRVLLGGHQVDQRISMVFDVSPDEARMEKHRPLNINEEVFEYTEENRVFNTLKTGVDEWIAEIEKVVKFYNSRKPDAKVEKCYLYGGGASVMGIDRYVSKVLGIPTEVVRGIGAVNGPNAPDADHLHLYLNAVGALHRLEESKR